MIGHPYRPPAAGTGEVLVAQTAPWDESQYGLRPQKSKPMDPTFSLQVWYHAHVLITRSDRYWGLPIDAVLAISPGYRQRRVSVGLRSCRVIDVPRLEARRRGECL
jgi:hypothetical protein